MLSRRAWSAASARASAPSPAFQSSSPMSSRASKSKSPALQGQGGVVGGGVDAGHDCRWRSAWLGIGHQLARVASHHLFASDIGVPVHSSGGRSRQSEGDVHFIPEGVHDVPGSELPNRFGNTSPGQGLGGKFFRFSAGLPRSGRRRWLRWSALELRGICHAREFFRSVCSVFC